MDPSEAGDEKPRPGQSVNVILTQSMPAHPLKSQQKLGEHARLLEACEGTAPWRQGGPYLSERQWGTHSVEQGQGPELALTGGAVRP